MVIKKTTNYFKDRLLLGFSPNCTDVGLCNRKFAVGWIGTFLKVFI